MVLRSNRGLTELVAAADVSRDITIAPLRRRIDSTVAWCESYTACLFNHQTTERLHSEPRLFALIQPASGVMV